MLAHPHPFRSLTPHIGPPTRWVHPHSDVKSAPVTIRLQPHSQRFGSFLTFLPLSPYPLVVYSPFLFLLRTHTVTCPMLHAFVTHSMAPVICTHLPHVCTGTLSPHDLFFLVDYTCLHTAHCGSLQAGSPYGGSRHRHLHHPPAHISFSPTSSFSTTALLVCIRGSCPTP